MLILNFTWGIIQNIIGAIAYGICKAKGYKTFKYKSAWCVSVPNQHGSISLGLFILGNLESENTIKHEYGHSIQSALLGVFYLLVIGLPSLMWATFGNKYRAKTGKSYYDFYTEKWADELGEVKRLSK